MFSGGGHRDLETIYREGGYSEAHWYSFSGTAKESLGWWVLLVSTTDRKERKSATHPRAKKLCLALLGTTEPYRLTLYWAGAGRGRVLRHRFQKGRFVGAFSSAETSRHVGPVSWFGF